MKEYKPQHTTAARRVTCWLTFVVRRTLGTTLIERRTIETGHANMITDSRPCDIEFRLIEAIWEPVDGRGSLHSNGPGGRRSR